MTRSKLVAATAALTLTLAACADDGEDTTTDATQTETEGGDATEDGGAEDEPAEGDDADASGDVTGTVSDAQVADDGSVELTVDTGDGEQELTTSTAAYITTSDGGSQQRARLTNWLENSDFDPDTEYRFEQFGGVVTDIHEA